MRFKSVTPPPSAMKDTAVPPIQVPAGSCASRVSLPAKARMRPLAIKAATSSTECSPFVIIWGALRCGQLKMARKSGAAIFSFFLKKS
jgi:hypothetical protein